MKKSNVFRSMIGVAFFVTLSSVLSGCFYPSSYAYRPYRYARPYARVYTPPPPPPPRYYRPYQKHYQHGHAYGKGYNNYRKSYGNNGGYARGRRR